MAHSIDSFKLQSMIDHIVYTLLEEHKIISTCENKQKIAHSQIQMLCYFCDFDYYKKYERSISGTLYVAGRRHPQPILYNDAIDQLLTDDCLKYSSKKKISPGLNCGLNIHRSGCLCIENNHMLERPILLPEEIRSMDETLNRLRDIDLVEYVNVDVPYLITDEYQMIEYEAVFCRQVYDGIDTREV